MLCLPHTHITQYLFIQRFIYSTPNALIKALITCEHIHSFHIHTYKLKAFKILLIISYFMGFDKLWFRCK